MRRIERGRVDSQDPISAREVPLLSVAKFPHGPYHGVGPDVVNVLAGVVSF
jgi:hypothetical protein